MLFFACSTVFLQMMMMMMMMTTLMMGVQEVCAEVPAGQRVRVHHACMLLGSRGRRNLPGSTALSRGTGR